MASDAPSAAAPERAFAGKAAAPPLERLRPTNWSGGLEGGITNGLPVVAKIALEPIATTLTAQSTVDLAPTRRRFVARRCEPRRSR